MVIVVATGVAHASGRHANWKAVERMAPGAPISVDAVGQAGTEQCLFVAADDASLTCRRDPNPDSDWRGGANARLVFPRQVVQAVSVWKDVSDRRVLIAMGVGFGIGALVCAEGGPAVAFICAGIGALIGAGASIGPAPAGPWGYPPGTRRSAPPPEMEWKLVYRAPASAAVSP